MYTQIYIYTIYKYIHILCIFTYTDKYIHICPCLYIYKYLYICGIFPVGYTGSHSQCLPLEAGFRVKQRVESVWKGRNMYFSLYISLVFDYILYH